VDGHLEAPWVRRVPDSDGIERDVCAHDETDETERSRGGEPGSCDLGGQGESH
jgi:hypothetical protein